MTENTGIALPPLSDDTIARIENAVFDEIADDRASGPAVPGWSRRAPNVPVRRAQIARPITPAGTGTEARAIGASSVAIGSHRRASRAPRDRHIG